MKYIDLAYLMREASDHRGALLAAALLSLAASAASLATPWLAGIVTDTLLRETGVALLVAGLVSLIVARGILAFINRVVTSRVSSAIAHDIACRVYGHLQALPLGWHYERHRGDVLSIVTHDAEILGRFISGNATSLLPQALTFVGAFVLMWVTDPGVALIAGALVPLSVIGLRLAGRRLRPRASAWVSAYGDWVAVAEENLELVSLVRIFGREPEEARRFREAGRTVRDLGHQLAAGQAGLTLMVQLLAAGGLALLLLYGSGLMSSRAVTPGELVRLLLYAALLVSPLQTLAGIYGSLQQARGSLERIHDLWQQQRETAREGSEELSITGGSIAFRDVWFGYPGRDRLFQGFSLEIGAGETVALTGGNGAGKSTLIHLLLRLFEPEPGQILVDDQPIQHYSRESLRRQIGFVPQQVLLLNGTVRDNIRYGMPGAGDADVREAARLASAEDFIDALPAGYDMVIGDQGVKLSGGQRQRLALARALVRNPRILIFDEATSMFDPHAEQAFITACAEALATRTVILVTHRPAALALADRVIRLENGRIVEIVSGARPPSPP